MARAELSDRAVRHLLACRPMLDCSRFLEGYSAFRDGELESRELSEYVAHLRKCESCARYDRVIDSGVRLYRSADELTPSDEFLPRLQHRLYHIDEEMRVPGRSGSGTSAALTLGISALIAAAAWLPALKAKPAVLELPPIAARAPLPPSVGPGILFQRGPLLLREPRPSNEWVPMYGYAGSRDLIFRYSPAGSQYQVQSVSRH